MVIVLGVMALIAGGIFVSVSGESRKRKQQNPIPYNTTEEPTKARAAGLD
jgi:hypothetical protein